MKSAASQNVIRYLVAKRRDGPVRDLRRRGGALLVMLFAGSIAIISARSARASSEIHELYRGARAQAMGNAFTAVADDEEAVFYNPAGLAGIEGFKLNYIDETAEVSTDTILKVKDNIALFKDFNFDKLNGLMGQNIYMRSQFTPGFVMPNFGFAAIVDEQAAVNLKNQVFPSTSLGYQMTNGFQMATGVSVLPKSRRAKSDLRIGIAGKMLWRRGGYHVLTMPELLSLNKDTLSDLAGSYEKGTGVDLGVQYIRQVTDRFKLSAGTTFQNIGDIQFGPKGDPLKSALNAGVAATYKGGLYKTTFAVDERHILEDVAWSKKFHMGTEFSIPLVSVYLGLSETNLSYGASVDIWLFKFTALSYAEELATLAGQDTSRRYMFQLVAKVAF